MAEPPATEAATISVIVPVWNGERFLGECLESLRAQDRPVDQIVVVDDGSTDGSAAVAEGFPRTTVLRREHEGLPATRNAGLAAASGTLIAFSDSDDLWRPEKARLQEQHLRAEPGCDVVLCRNEVFFAPGVERPAWLRDDQLLGDPDGVPPTSGLFRRGVFDTVGGYRAEAGYTSDTDLLIRLRTAGFRLDILDDVLIMRRIHEDNMNQKEEIDYLPPMFQMVRDHVHAVRRRRA